MNTTHTIDKYIESAMKATNKGKFGAREKIFFFKELSYLLKGGVSIIDAIKTMRDTSNNQTIKDINDYMYTSLNQGKSITYSLSRMPDHFSEGDVSIIKSGEKSGRLVTVLASLASEYTFLGKIKSQYIGAMIYPVILTFVAFVAVLALFLFILPGIFEIVTEFEGAEIPATTRLLMSFSSFLANNIVTLFIGAVILAVGGGLAMSTKGGKRAFFSFVSSVPFIGKMTQRYNLIKFARYTKLMLEAGLSYRDVFLLQKEIMATPHYQEMIDDVLAGLDIGESIFERMKEYEELIPSDVLVLLKVGEETATLKESLDNIVEMYEEDLRNMINNVSKVIEPVLIVVVGGIIALIALSVFGIIGTVLDTLPAL